MEPAGPAVMSLSDDPSQQPNVRARTARYDPLDDDSELDTATSSSSELEGLLGKDGDLDADAAIIIVDDEDDSKRERTALIKLAQPKRKKATAAGSGQASVSQASASSSSSSSRKEKVLFLDGVRGLAAIGVLVQHSHWFGYNFGQNGVDTFFVLSAFLLTSFFDRKVQQLLARRAGLVPWSCALADYFVRRLLRVYPLFALVAAFIWWLPNNRRKQYFISGDPTKYDLEKVLTFEMSSRYHVFWTLPVEIGYYFVIPGLVTALAMVGRFWPAPLLLMLIWVVQEGLHTSRGPHQPLRPHLMTFVAGSIAAILQNRLADLVREHSFEFRWYHRVVVRAVEYTVLGFLLSLMYGGLFFDWVMANPAPKKPGGSAFIAVHVATIMAIEMLVPGPVSSFFEWSLFRFWGKISFSMYLLHSFVCYDVVLNREPRVNQYVSYLVLTSVLSMVSYHLVEEPLQNVASHVSQKIKAVELTYSNAVGTSVSAATAPTLPK
ncbi:hypothetical protein P43SY_004112 [Pythium insidiosum]|uniref:Acyltransferase 3 domain-containing protein n=1 Tax=Pythium insidiosum TaxID=114742 RepID=A0AAD5M486_PYTIN|nr:hypothetical protein P43SY_004112 [Pythium insidiosum]